MATSVKTTSPCQNGDSSINVQLLSPGSSVPPPTLTSISSLPSTPTSQCGIDTKAGGAGASLVTATDHWVQTSGRQVGEGAEKPHLGSGASVGLSLIVNYAAVPQILPPRQQVPPWNLSLSHKRPIPGLWVKRSHSSSPAHRFWSEPFYGSGPSTSAAELLRPTSLLHG